MRNHPVVGIQTPDVLIPKAGLDLQRWSVIACDQFTSQPDYWEKVKVNIGDSPSTLNLILPEVYLGNEKETDLISRINATMRKYIQDDILVQREGMILVERTISHGKRHGLILALDLEKYDFHKESKSLIRATEGTILERLPPRMRIRENAILELPHILVLIDDPQNEVLEPLWEKRNSFPCIYNFDLMFSSGHVQGYLINDLAIEKNLVGKLEQLIQPYSFQKKYQLTNNNPPILFAVGDGNHSLATAKAIWEKKKADLPSDHPLRYALVEIVNLHDPGLFFQPIHRVLFDLKQDLLIALREYFGKIEISPCNTFSELREMVQKSERDLHIIGLIENHAFKLIHLKHPNHQLATGSIQSFLDGFLTRKGAEGIDYIHDDDAILAISQKSGNAGFYLPPMQKNELYKTVIMEGALPRKTFSMGEAVDKRFYLECRQIQGF
jgi:hypothetical protein